MMPFLVCKHIALVIVSVFTAIAALEGFLAQMNVLLVCDKRLPRSETFSTVAAVKLFVLLCSVHSFHVKLNSAENSTTDVAGRLLCVYAFLVTLQMIWILHYNVAFGTFC